MGLVRMHGHVEAPVEAVFDYAVDFNRSAEWNVNIVEMAPSPPLAKVGDTFSGKMKFLGRIYTGSGTVTEFERPKVIAFTSASPDGGHQNWTTRFTPVATGTDVDVLVDYEVPLSIIGAIADKLFIEKTFQRDLEQSRDNFRAMAEHKMPAPV
jgi:uncharacterized protein YndB with AHSA1/START domain